MKRYLLALPICLILALAQFTRSMYGRRPTVPTDAKAGMPPRLSQGEIDVGPALT